MRINQAWGRASVAVIANHKEATYYSNTGGGCLGGKTGTTLCGHPDDKWGFAVLSGAEIKLDMLSPGSRIGGFLQLRRRRHAYGGRGNLTSPGLYGSGNRLLSVRSPMVRTSTARRIEQTTAWSTGAGFEYFWTRNFSSTIYGAYTEVTYNSTVTNNGWFCNGGSGGIVPVRLSGATCDPGFKYWSVGTHHDWFPLPGLRFAVDVMYTASNRKWLARRSLWAAKSALVRAVSIPSGTWASPPPCSAPSAAGALTKPEPIHRSNDITPGGLPAGGFACRHAIDWGVTDRCRCRRAQRRPFAKT